MGEEMSKFRVPFNSSVEIGLRSMSILCDGYPEDFSLQQLVIFDYLTIHSDDIPGGPIGLHPKTPNRSGEILVRRDTLQQGLLLYMSRGLLERRFSDQGVRYSATESTATFLDSLQVEYISLLRERSLWVINEFSTKSEDELNSYINKHIGEWGAEFELESTLWWEEEI